MHAEGFSPKTKGDFAALKLRVTGLTGLENLSSP